MDIINKIRISAAFALIFFLQISYAGIFTIRVNDISGYDRPWPLVASLPFAEGELKDSSQIRITGISGEIPSQVDVAATWRDGSIRWALAGFTSPPDRDYTVEYAGGVKRMSYPDPLKLSQDPGGLITVDTGAAVYQFEPDRLLPEKAWLVNGRTTVEILREAGDGAYIIDNSGRTSRISGKSAEVKNEFIKRGEGRAVLKRSGWYVTDTGERTARAEAWFYFSAGVPYVKITHSLILTEDTNRIWIKDYGLEFKTPSPPADVYLTSGENGKEEIKKYEAAGREIFMLQDQYPHFAEKDSRALFGACEKGSDRILSEASRTGDWAHAGYGNFGITIVMPWLAERFPKEISFGEKGGRAVFWSGRSGRELDFRSTALARDYWKSWAEKGRGTPGLEKLSKIPNNAQGTSHTHDAWFLPHMESNGLTESVRKAALAASRIPLATASTERICATEAMGFPMHHKDTARFPKEEAFISDSWDRFTIPDRVFPMTGFINWGHCPYLSYHKVDGKWYASFTAYGNMNGYNVRRNVWHLYARSGERRYFEYGHAFNRILGDFGIAHWDAPGKPMGSFTRTIAPIHFLPYYWGNTHLKYEMGNSSSDIGNWLMEYYLTGNEQAREVTVKAGESIKRLWNLEEALDWEKTLSFLALRTLSILYMREWDPDFLNMANQLAHSLIKIDEQTGVNPEYMTYRDAMYKDQRHTVDLYFYHSATGDELGKKAFLKILDHRYRYNRIEKAISYQNSTAFAYPIAYLMTGNEKYRRITQETIKDSLDGFTSTLEETLEKMGPDPDKWATLPRLSNPSQTHPFLGMPVALKMVAESGYNEEIFPILVKNNDMTREDILLEHSRGRETFINISYSTMKRGKIKPSVFPYPSGKKDKPLKGIRSRIEERIPGMVNETLNRPVSDTWHYTASISIPASFSSGLYTVSLESDDPYTVLDSNSPGIGLYCPGGFWSATSSGTSILGTNKPFFFRVPEGLENLEIFLASPQKICDPDGKTVVEYSSKNTGKLSIPVNNRYGFWSIGTPAYFPSAFAKLLNIEPIVSYASPKVYPQAGEIKNFTPDKGSPGPANNMEFVPGISGKALRLTGNRTISFPRGEEMGDGSYASFPGETGTIEFWYRPDWSAQEIILYGADSFRTRSLLEGPHIHLGYRYGVRMGRPLYFSDLIMELLGTFPGAEPFRSFLQAKSLIGREEHCLFKAGTWNHLAFVWAYQPIKQVIPEKPVLGDIKWPSRWRFFGPVNREDPVLTQEVLNSYPETIEVNGKKLEAKEVSVFNTRYDFPAMLQHEPTGKTVYVFLKINSKSDQEVTLGMGADWWMQAWVNGRLIHDTTETSNKVFPFSIWNHMVNTKLKKGENILAVRFIRGGGSLLALGGPGELRTPDASTLKWEFNMFLNGKKMDNYRSVERDRFLRSPGDKVQPWQSKCDLFTLATENKKITIGPLDGSMDILRISDIARYTSNFEPPRAIIQADGNTRALFLFDGNLDGSSTSGKEKIEAR